MAAFGERWKGSLGFRRVVVVAAFVVAALAVSAGSLFTRAVGLPTEEINARSVALLGQQAVLIEAPQVADGGLVLSYEGSKNEVADLRLGNATLDPGSQRLFFPNGVASGPGKISYTTGDVEQAKPGAADNPDTCHTTIEVRRAAESAPVQALKLYQTDETAGAQRFRQVVVDAGETPLVIEAHTDAPPQMTAAQVAATPGCQKVLTVGDQAPVALPEYPVKMRVDGGTIDLHFYPSNPALSIYTGQNESFEGVSLGEGTMQAKEVEVVPMGAAAAAAKPKLAVQARPTGSLLSVGQLKLGSEMLRVQVGRDGETAVAQAGGAGLYNYNVTDIVQKVPLVKNNPLLSWGLGLLLISPLGAWVKKSCFPDEKG